jgi:hypothetical protein
MELDELKNILKEKMGSDFRKFSAPDFENLIKGNTFSVLEKVKRSLVFEWFLAIGLTLGFGIIAILNKEIYIRFFSGLSLIICIPFLFYLKSLGKKISLYENSTLNIRESLEQIIQILQRFTRLYFRISMGILPAAFLFGLIMGYLEINRTRLAGHFQWTRALYFYCFLFILWAVLNYFFSRWYIRKLYGTYLNEIKSHLKDLENG